MAWTITPIIQSSDWTETSFQNEIISAINQRITATNGYTTSISTISDGYDLQNYTYILYLQQKIETLVGYTGSYYRGWLTTLDSSSNRIDYNGYNTETLENWDWTKIKARVLPGSDWTRKYYSGGSVVTGYGNHQAGDIIGYWLFDEMVKVLDELYITSGYYLQNSNTPSGNILRAFGNSGSTWAVAKDNAEDEWINDNLWEQDYSPVCASYGVSYLMYGGGTQYKASLYNAYQEYKIDSLHATSGISKDVMWYVYAEKPPVRNTTLGYQPYGGSTPTRDTFVEFDNNAFTEIEENKWKLVNTDSMADTDTSTSYFDIGDSEHSMPDWCDSPPLGDVTASGWWARHIRPFIYWDFDKLTDYGSGS